MSDHIKILVKEVLEAYFIVRRPKGGLGSPIMPHENDMEVIKRRVKRAQAKVKRKVTGL